MKKIDLLQTTVLIIAILCGYAALQAVLAMLNTSFYISDLFYARGGGGTALLPTFIQAGLYVIACIILVRSSKKIATWLLGDERVEFEEFPETGEAREAAAAAAAGGHGVAEDPAAPEWHLDRRSILFSFFVGLGLYMLIRDIPTLLNEVIAEFRDNVRTGVLDIRRPTDRDYLILDLLRVTIDALLIYVAPTLTNYLEKTIAVRLKSGSKIM